MGAGSESFVAHRKTSIQLNSVLSPFGLIALGLAREENLTTFEKMNCRASIHVKASESDEGAYFNLTSNNVNIGRDSLDFELYSESGNWGI